MKYLICIAIALLIATILSSCGADSGLTCFNYCSETIYVSEIMGVVRDSTTNQPISGALVTLTEPPNQICETCRQNIGTITVTTDEEGWFRVPPSTIFLPDLYIIYIAIEAENCQSYIEEYEARALDNAIYGFTGQVFNLTCS
jgi:hypothetical protein